MQFFQNKYYKWYFNIIQCRRTFIYSGYTESHHIIPSAIGGSDLPDNKVSLSAREHFICHLLLTKMLAGDDKIKMLWAAHNMIYWKRKTHERSFKISSRTYKYLKENLTRTKDHCEKISESNRNRICSQETKDKRRLNQLGVSLSQNAKSKLSNFWKGNPKSEEQKEKIRQSHLNLSPEKRAHQLAGQKIKTDSMRENMRKAALNRDDSHNQKIRNSLKESFAKMPIAICPHCLKSGKGKNFSRWHFDKCKFRTDRQESVP